MSDTPSTFNYINIGPKGTFRRSGKYKTSTENVDELVTYLRYQKDKKRIVLFFHGGLVSEAAGMKSAANIQAIFENTHIHPISLVWESGFSETIKTRLGSVGDTRFFRKLVEYAAKVAGDQIGMQELGGKGINSLTEDDVRQELLLEEPFHKYDQVPGAKGWASLEAMDDESLKSELEANLNQLLQADDDSLTSAELQKETAFSPLLDRDKLSEDPVQGSKGLVVPLRLIKALVTVTFRVVKRHIRKTDHGFFPTLVEEILREFYLADFGAWVWGGMKQQAEDMWSPNDNLAGDELHAGSYLLARLTELKSECPKLTIDLIGHSAGSIVACNLLKITASRHPQLVFRNVIFLAPACSVDTFALNIVDRQTRFEAFRMFTMFDQTECADHLVGGLYTRSLLYFISGVLEQTDDKPIVGLHRHIQGNAPYDSGNPARVSEYLLSKGAHRLILSQTAPGSADGLTSSAKTHTSFDEDKLTIASIVHLCK